MFDVVKKILTSDEYNSIMGKVDLLRMACSDDEELIDAFILSRIFIIKEADNSDKRIKIVSEINSLGYTVPNDVLKTLGSVLNKDSHDFEICQDIITLDNSNIREVSYPLGYISDEVLRSIDIHEQIKDEDVVSSIDGVFKKLTDIMFIKTPEVRQLISSQKSKALDSIHKILTKDIDLSLMSQVKEACRIIIDWRC